MADVIEAKHDNARSGAGDVHSQVGKSGSAVVVASSNARDVRTIEADIGQFTIAELGQLRNVALILTERLNHADEREQHDNLLKIFDSALGQSVIVEMNIV
jgi:hypothetical protein